MNFGVLASMFQCFVFSIRDRDQLGLLLKVKGKHYH